MPFISVPWFVEGGAENPAETARILAYAATKGATGVMGPDDLRVSQMPVVGAGVSISTGAAVCENLQPGYEYQSYILSRPIADDTLSIPPNTGTSTRYDLVVARVENPFTEVGLPAPASVTDGPYVRARVFTNVGAANTADQQAAIIYLNGRSMTGVPLARIAVPAGASSIVNSYITSLRVIANPRRERRLLTFAPPARMNASQSGWTDWVAPTGWNVFVPSWATRLTVNCTIYGARLDRQSSSVDGKAAGQLRLVLGTGNPATAGVDAQASQSSSFDFDAPSNSGATRVTAGFGDYMYDLLSNLGGNLQRMRIQSNQTSGNQPLYIDTASSVVLDYEFVEYPV